MDRKIYYIDIDGTIAQTNNGDYENARPIPKNIAKINKLYKARHTIVYWTARGTNSGKNWYRLTEKQLIKWGAKYTWLEMGKPSFDYIVDDRAIKISEL